MYSKHPSMLRIEQFHCKCLRMMSLNRVKKRRKKFDGVRILVNFFILFWIERKEIRKLNSAANSFNEIGRKINLLRKIISF